MAPIPKKYRPGEVNLEIGDELLSGYAKGSFVKVEETKERVLWEEGTDGEIAVSVQEGVHLIVTFLLMQTSASNDVLDALAEANTAGPGMPGVRRGRIKDLNGRAIYETQTAVVLAKPEADFAEKATAREWKVLFPNAIARTRGNEAL
jgi:hypothetical protein